MMEKEAMKAIIEEKNRIMRERSGHHEGPEPPISEATGEPMETKKTKKKANKKGVKGKKRTSKGKKKKDIKKRPKKSGISKKKN